MSSLLAGFFDGFLFNVAAIAAVLTAFDWLVGENGRKKLRERVGDFWTTLQYQSLDELYVSALQKLRLKLNRVYGEKVLSARFILVAFAANVLWVAVSSVAVWGWTAFGQELVQIAPSIPVETYIGIALTMLIFSLLIGWYPIANFFRVVQQFSSGASFWRVFYSPLFVLWNAFLFFIVAAVIILLAWVVFEGVTFGAENYEQIVQQLIREKEMGLDPMNNKAMMDFTIKFMFPFVASTFFILLPISALPFFISLFMVLILACLKLLRPLLQPLISLLLERLYESKQGVLTQIAWVLGAVSKAVQEILKHVV
jgi:hypothetical protein